MSVDPLLAARRRNTGEEFRRRALSWPAAAGFVIATIAALFTHWAVMPAGFVVILLFAYAQASKQAHDTWWGELAEHFGLHVAPPMLPGYTPLLRSGDEREVRGLATDGERQLARFTTTDVSRDSKGNRQESDHHYTLVVYADPAPPRPLRFVAAHERMLMGLMDDKRGRMPANVDDHDLEHAALNKRFTVRIADEDAPRLGEVFEPSFMLWLAEHGRPFEYEGGVLVVYDDRHLNGTGDYAALLDDAAKIRARLRAATGAPLPREPQATPPPDPSAGSIPPPPA